ncbi:MAG: hypothetical protein FWE09_05935, partial [Treponema sp.]|nr:hypothetical protein [Treponema sp.]
VVVRSVARAAGKESHRQQKRRRQKQSFFHSVLLKISLTAIDCKLRNQGRQEKKPKKRDFFT